MNHKARTFLLAAALLSAVSTAFADEPLAESTGKDKAAPSQFGRGETAGSAIHKYPHPNPLPEGEGASGLGTLKNVKPIADRCTGQGIEPVWRNAVDRVVSGLKKALDQYKGGNIEQAKKAVTAAQYDGYKNSLLETAVRKSISQRKDFQNNARFTEIIGLMDKGEPASRVQEAISALTNSLEEDLPALRLVEGAVPEEVLEEQSRRIREEDWAKVSEELFAALGGAIGIYSQSKKSEALDLAKRVYFESYEESGLEARIDSVSREANMRLGGHFSKLVRQMESDEPPERIEHTQAELRTEMIKAVSTLGQVSANRVTSFFNRVRTAVRGCFQ